MAEPEVEAAWRAEFKLIGETQVRDALDSITDEPKRQAAIVSLIGVGLTLLH
jgi:hypothetical protein